MFLVVVLEALPLQSGRPVSKATNFNSTGDIMFFQNVFNRLVRSLPFRMAIGKLGIRLVAIGRCLQVRYANWNSEFRLRFEVMPAQTHGRNCADFHVSGVVTDNVLTFHTRGSQLENQSGLVRGLFGIKGVANIVLYPYCIRINKAEVFSWDELRPDIERVILENLTGR